VAFPLADTLAVTWRDLTVLQTQIEYVTVPRGRTFESRCTSEADTQMAPGFGVGVGDFDGLGDWDGLGDLVGEGLGLLDGVVVFEGDGLVAVGLGLPVALGPLVGLGLPLALGLPVGLGLRDGLELPVGLTLPLAGELALADGPESEMRLALMALVEADPHRLLSGKVGSASTGATAGPDSRNKPAPAAAATCPTRTTLTGTAALR
jgi:hypothetical protein